MAIEKNTLKEYFRTGAKPTEAQFGDLIDSMRHMGDSISMTDVQGLPEGLNGKFSTAEGAALTQAVQQVTDIQSEHKSESDRQFSSLRASIEVLSASGAGSELVAERERVVGKFEDIDGATHDLYENTFTIQENLPSIVGSVSDVILAAEPLGFGMYIRVVEVQQISSDSFWFDAYAVDRIYVAEGQTHAVVRCVRSDEGMPATLSIRMRYIKYMGDRLQFSVTLPDGVDPATVNLTVAPLKYDKRMAFTYTADDSVVGAYARVWSRINRKWIDDMEFHHMNAERTTGAVPKNTLCMTDGCGNERRFGFSCAIWPNLGNQYSPNGFIKDSTTSTTSPYITWEELRMIVDYGVSLCFHNVDERIYDKTSAAEIVRGFVDDDRKAFEKTGRRMKVLGLPDGNRAYVEAAGMSNLVAFMRSSLNSSSRINLHTCGPLRGQYTYGGTNSSDVTVKLAELAEQHAAENPYWVGITSHRVSLEVIAMLETIYNLYGKAGDDSVWVAGWDEIYEYIAMREGMTCVKRVEGQRIDFDVYVPSSRAFYFRELSLLLSGIASAEGVAVVPATETIKGYSYAAHTARWTGEAALLLNLNFNGKAVELAEKYTARYEATADASDKEDAQYFSSQLRPELAEPFVTRIENVVPGEPGGLRLIGATINSGATTTTNRAVTIELTLTGEPTHYRTSEDEDFMGASWLPYTTPFLPYMLTDVPGSKTVYCQVKNASTESAVVSTSITLEESDTPIRIVLNSITINGGAATTTKRDVMVAFNSNLTPTHYRIGESSDLSSTSWTAYTGNSIVHSLSANNGQKTIYAQVKNADAESSVVFGVINLQESVSPTKTRAILSLGWDYSAGGAVGTSTFDTTMQIGKVRLSGDGTSYDLYDTGGNILGAAVITGIKTTGSTFMGQTTGDNSGVYPDNVLKFSGYKQASTPEAIVSMSIPSGNYRIKVFINAGTSKHDFSGASYTLEHAGTTQRYAIKQNYVGNFTDTSDLTLTVGDGPVILRIQSGNVADGTLLFLNAIDIEEI